MSTNTASAASRRGRRRRRRRRRDSLPDWILLNDYAYIGSRCNATTAVGETRNKLTIEASLWPARPPLPSNLFVYCPGAGVNIHKNAKIICTADDLLLLRVAVAVGHLPSCIHFTDWDYFVYRAGRSPSLTLLPSRRSCGLSFLQDVAVGLLRCRGGDHYTVATLVATSAQNEYMLYRFDSDADADSDAWKVVRLDAPRWGCRPVKIPPNASRLNHHVTTTVITLGGEAGTMGWVDLWSGILLCDLLRQEGITLRHVPLPLPMDLITCNQGMGAELGCPMSRRGIAACIKDGKTCLKLAELQITGERLPYTDIETDAPAFRVDDWAITTWSNTKMTHSYDDWHEDFTILASKIKISKAMRSRLLASGLLHRKPSRDDGEEEAAAAELALQNLMVSEPTPSLNGEEDVVYMMARTELFHPKAWVLAVDMRNNALQGVAEFGTESRQCFGVSYCPSNISKHMDPATTPVTSAT